jgi:hypothetical protein
MAKTTVVRVVQGQGGPYVRLEDLNGEILAVSESYDSNSNARRAAAAWEERLIAGGEVSLVDETSQTA